MRRYRGYLKSKGLSDSTIKAYSRRVSIFFEWANDHSIKLRKVTYSHMMDYIAHQKRKGMTPRGINQDQIALRYYFESLGMKNNPSEDIHVKGTPKSIPKDILSSEQLQQLYTDCDSNTAHRLRDKVIVGLMVFQGATAGDFELLQPKDIDLNKGKIKLPKRSTTNERTLTLHPQQMIDLYRFIEAERQKLNEERERPSQLLVFSSSTSDSPKSILQRLARRLKKQHPHFRDYHQLRASVITGWVKQFNLRETQHMAGHRYVSSTEKYQRADMTELQMELGLFDPMKKKLP